jgi:hypothetical protein
MTGFQKTGEFRAVVNATDTYQEICNQGLAHGLIVNEQREWLRVLFFGGQSFLTLARLDATIDSTVESVRLEVIPELQRRLNPSRAKLCVVRFMASDLDAEPVYGKTCVYAFGMHEPVNSFVDRLRRFCGMKKSLDLVVVQPNGKPLDPHTLLSDVYKASMSTIIVARAQRPKKPRTTSTTTKHAKATAT